jgi:hypothetical protein
MAEAHAMAQARKQSAQTKSSAANNSLNRARKKHFGSISRCAVSHTSSLRRVTNAQLVIRSSRDGADSIETTRSSRMR